MLVANHQNAMLDPVLICLFLPKQLHWLTRADVFKKPAVNFLLKKFNMLPVYRERDKVPHLHALNNQTFEEAYLRLSAKSVVCLFPEGTHRGKKQLHTLKKGVARMSASIIEKNLSDAVILPVGLDYENFYSYRKDILIKIGKPISLADYKYDFEKDLAKSQNMLLGDIRDGLKAVMIDITRDDIYETLIHLRNLCYEASNSHKPEKQFDHYHAVCELADNNDDFAETVKQKGKLYLQLTQTLRLNDEYYSAKRPLKAIILSVLLAIPSLPGIIIFYPVYLLTEMTQQKLVKDPLFINSIRVVFWAFITQLWLLILLLITQFFVQDFTLSLLSVLAIMLSGFIALQWAEFRKQTLAWSSRQTAKNNMSDKYQNWSALRAELVEILRLKNYR